MFLSVILQLKDFWTPMSSFSSFSFQKDIIVLSAEKYCETNFCTFLDRHFTFLHFVDITEFYAEVAFLFFCSHATTGLY